MSRLLALAASALLGFAVPAAAAPVVFQASAAGSSLSLTCGPSAGKCTRLEADLLFNDGKRRVSGPLDPDLNFGMILFDGEKADEDDDKKKYGKSDKKSKDSLFSDTFGITATLAFFINDPSQLFKVIAKGDGSYSVKEDDLKSLTLAWQPIEDLFVPGIGTFAFSFSNLGVINAPTLFARSANSNDDDEDQDENDGGISLRVAATVTQVSVVPLPAGGLLLLSAFGLLALSARQRRRALAA